MKKYTLYDLMVEITRKCNKKCPHCMRGEAQDVTISEELIDKLINETEDVLSMSIGGGEALLEIERLQYLVQKVIESNWTTRFIQVTTNGSICDQKLIDTLERFCISKDGRVALIRISNDQFHDKEEYTKAFDFYSVLVGKANTRICIQQPNSKIFLKYTQRQKNELPYLYYMGDAVNLIDDGESGYAHGKNVKYPDLYPHRIKIIENTIPCTLYLSANGNVGFDLGDCYNHGDTIAIGDLHKAHMTDIVDTHNENCLLLCSETDIIKMGDYCEKLVSVPRGSIPYFKLYSLMCRRILELRYKAKELFPNIPAQEIIYGLPFPKEREVEDLVLSMYVKCPEYTPEMIHNIRKYSNQKKKVYMGAASSVVLRNLRKSQNKDELWDYFSDDEDLLYLSEFEDFHELNEQYGNNKQANEWNFVCVSPAGNISYQPDTTVDISDSFIDAAIEFLKSEQEMA